MTSLVIDRQIETSAAHAPRTEAVPHGQNDALAFADPALEEFAAAVRRSPLSLAGWAVAAAWKAMGRAIARKLDIE